jgi:hypothetical protein
VEALAGLPQRVRKAPILAWGDGPGRGEGLKVDVLGALRPFTSPSHTGMSSRPTERSLLRSMWPTQFGGSALRAAVVRTDAKEVRSHWRRSLTLVEYALNLVEEIVGVPLRMPSDSLFNRRLSASLNNG